MFAIRRFLPNVARTISVTAKPRSFARPLPVAVTQQLGFKQSFSSVLERNATVQKPAPNWMADAVVDGQIKQVSLTDYKGKFVVMVFYPADFTFVCPTELLAFSDRIEDFRKIGAEVVGVSVDNVHSHLAWTQQPRNKGGLGDIKIPLASDIRKEIAASYNVLIPEAGLALRGLFVIDPKGILRIAHINDLPIGRSVDETLRLVEAIKFTDEHGEVCPANWQKGGKTIKPNPKESQEYFKDQ